MPRGRQEWRGPLSGIPRNMVLGAGSAAPPHLPRGAATAQRQGTLAVQAETVRSGLTAPPGAADGCVGWASLALPQSAFCRPVIERQAVFGAGACATNRSHARRPSRSRGLPAAWPRNTQWAEKPADALDESCRRDVSQHWPATRARYSPRGMLTVVLRAEIYLRLRNSINTTKGVVCFLVASGGGELPATSRRQWADCRE